MPLAQLGNFQRDSAPFSTLLRVLAILAPEAESPSWPLSQALPIPDCPTPLSVTELRRLFQLAPQERRWLATLHTNQSAQLDAGVCLKCFQYQGYFPRPSSIPSPVVRFISSELKFDSATSVSPNQRSSHHIKQAVRDRCQVKPFSAMTRESGLFDFACQMALTKESPIDIINAMIETLIKESFELPEFSTLDRYAVCGHPDTYFFHG